MVVRLVVLVPIIGLGRTKTAKDRGQALGLKATLDNPPALSELRQHVIGALSQPEIHNG